MGNLLGSLGSLKVEVVLSGGDCSTFLGGPFRVALNAALRSFAVLDAGFSGSVIVTCVGRFRRGRLAKVVVRRRCSSVSLSGLLPPKTSEPPPSAG